MIKLILQQLILLPTRVLLIISGFFVVAIALPFRKVHDGTEIPFTEASGNWKLVTLPKWAWLWSNDRDGALGDTSGWYASHTPFNLPVDSFIPMYYWLAIRNPANNSRFTKMFGCYVPDCTYTYTGDRYVKDKFEYRGKQFVVATNTKTKRRYYGFYYVKPYTKKKAIVIQIGFKIQPHNFETDYSKDPQGGWKGFTNEINLFKNI